MRSLSILIGLALIATAIYFKPPEPALACVGKPSSSSMFKSFISCFHVKGKYMTEVTKRGQLRYLWKMNLETGGISNDSIFSYDPNLD